MSPFQACSFSFQNKMVTLCFIAPPQSAPEVHHCQYVMAANVVAILTCDVPNVVCPYIWVPLGAQLVKSKISYDSMLCASVHIHFHWQGTNSSISILVQSILYTCSALWICDSVRLSHSWHAFSKHTEPFLCCL